MGDFKLNNDEAFYVSLILEDKRGTISAADAGALSEWRSLNKENSVLYNEILEVEDNLSLLEIYGSLDVEDSLTRLHQKLDAPQKTRSKAKVMAMNWTAIAACLILVLFGILYANFRNDTTIIETDSLQSKTFILPDGSKLTLNRGSEVTFSKKDFKNERAVLLVKGECFFEVVHNERKPFSVQYEGLKITDIGTAFNVQLTKRMVEVIVNEGKVQMTTENEPIKTLLDAGESAIFSFDSGSIQKSKLYDANYKAYVDHNFNFTNTSLSEVIVSLSNGFHKKIILSTLTLKNKRLTAEFKDQKLEDILIIISKSLNVKTSIKDDVIYIFE